MSLDWGRKLENPVTSHVDTGRKGPLGTQHQHVEVALWRMLILWMKVNTVLLWLLFPHPWFLNTIESKGKRCFNYGLLWSQSLRRTFCQSQTLRRTFWLTQDPVSMISQHDTTVHNHSPVKQHTKLASWNVLSWNWSLVEKLFFCAQFKYLLCFTASVFITLNLLLTCLKMQLLYHKDGWIKYCRELSAVKHTYVIW